MSYDFAGEYRKIVQTAPKIIALLEKMRAVSPLCVAWSLLALGYGLLGEKDDAAKSLK